jgi:hypothetical protein
MVSKERTQTYGRTKKRKTVGLTTLAFLEVKAAAAY